MPEWGCRTGPGLRRLWRVDRARRAAVIGLALAVAASGAAVAATDDGKAESAKPLPGPVVRPAGNAVSSAGSTITLITGQQVRLTPGVHGPQVDVVSIPAGSSPFIDTFDAGGDVYVVPRDAGPYINTLLDPSLFDVSRLSRLGIGSASQNSIPVSIDWRGIRRSTSVPGVSVHNTSTKAGTGTTGIVTASHAKTFGAALAAKFAADHDLHVSAGKKAPAVIGGLADVSRISLATPSQSSNLAMMPTQAGAGVPLDHNGGTTPSTAYSSSPGVGSSSADSNARLYTLQLQSLDRDGSTSYARFDIQNLDNMQHFWDVVWSGPGFPAAVSLPAGHYSIQSFVSPIPILGFGGVSFAENMSFVAMPEVTISGDTSLTADARTAKPITVTAPHATDVGQVNLSYQRVDGNGASLSGTEFATGTPELAQWADCGQACPQLHVFATPTPAPTVGSLAFSSDWLLEPTGRPTHGDSPYTYFLDYPDADGIPPSAFDHHETTSSLAAVHESYAADTHRSADDIAAAFPSWSSYAIGLMLSRVPEPGTRVDYFGGSPSTVWQQTVGLCEDMGVCTWFEGPDRLFKAGRTLTGEWGAGPLVPAPQDQSGLIDYHWSDIPTARDICTACRQDDNLTLNLSSYGDSVGHSVNTESTSGPATDTDFRFYRNGVLTQEQHAPFGELPMLPQQATYTIDWQTTLVTPYTAPTSLDTSVDSVWTFTSKRSDNTDKLPPYEHCAPDVTRGCTLVPLLFARYDLGTDLSQRVTADGLHTIRITGYQQPNQPKPAALASAKVEVSFDDGTTWNDADSVTKGGDGFQAGVSSTAPPGVTASGYVSLRVHLTDAVGNTLTQTIIHAYALPSAGQ